MREVAEEYLEKIAGQMVQEAEQLVLKADLEGAEKRFGEALSFKPDSRNALMAYGRFHFFDGNRRQGLDTLDSYGMTLGVPRLPRAPVLDGDLDEPAWSRAARIDRLFRILPRMGTKVAEGRAHIYLGYTDSSLCVAARSYEEADVLVAELKERDELVYRDDSVGFFFVPEPGQPSYYLMYSNSIGTIFDNNRVSTVDWVDASAWNGEERVGVRVEPAHWTMEMEIPFRTLGKKRVEPGEMWGCNIVRVRAGAGGMTSTWMPTFARLHRLNRFGFLVFE